MSDFDFLYGEWTVTNRRLRELFVGSDDWDEFPGTQHAWPIMGGVGGATWETNWVMELTRTAVEARGR